MTIAISALMHGEAVRLNRGQSRGDDFDFKYMRGRDGSIFPYVSSQCFKKYWRESLTDPFSPITREKDKAGKEKNQAYTSGDPIQFIDDDLFGYMIAGATDTSGETASDGEVDSGGEPPRAFEADNIRDMRSLKSKLLDETPLAKFIVSSKEAADKLRDLSDTDSQEFVLNLLDEAAHKAELNSVEGLKNPKKKSIKKVSSREEIRTRNIEVLYAAFPKELQEKPKLQTTKRTAPVRMHALVAFSGIRTAKDFQTFSRDVSYTGKNSIVNPAAQGIYSGWLKTRILIESHRIGKFYIGENLDILKDRVGNHSSSKESNPYSRGDFVEFIQLSEQERKRRLSAVLKALADIGNRQGPASGALHDGSLRPKAFVAAQMNCVDSPFDSVWLARNDDAVPEIDAEVLCNVVKDWEDLFAEKSIYIGLPADVGRRVWQAQSTDSAPNAQSTFQETKQSIEQALEKIGFKAVVDLPRAALLRLAADATMKKIEEAVR